MFFRSSRLKVQAHQGKLLSFQGIFLLVTLVLCQPALANEETAPDLKLRTAEQLQALCSGSHVSVNPDKAEAFCYGYILAALHYDYALHVKRDEKRLSCPEESASLRDVIQYFLTWLEENPQHKNDMPVEAVMRAANAKWPCAGQ